jgi:hypothetical protein
MKLGFMEHVAKILILEFPGQTAEWYAKAYLKEAGQNGSDAKNPVESLANTLSKQVKTGNEKRIKREKVNGIYHYFPIELKKDTQRTFEEVVVQLRISKEALRDIENLVRLGKVVSRNDAIYWLLLKGREAKRAYLSRLETAMSRIEEIKKEIESEN